VVTGDDDASMKWTRSRHIHVWACEPCTSPVSSWLAGHTPVRTQAARCQQMDHWRAPSAQQAAARVL